MKKIQKGESGYLDYKKKIEILRTTIYFIIVAIIFAIGYIETGTRLNTMTVIAVLGCLPSAKALVGVIARMPYSSTSQKIVQEVNEKAPHITKVYDLILTTREAIMPVECIVISGETIFGYTSNQKVNLEHLSKHIKEMMSQNNLSYSTIKFFHNYQAFLSRAEGLESIAVVEKLDTKELEQQRKNLLLQLSM